MSRSLRSQSRRKSRQQELPLPKVPDYRIIGEALNTYILVEQAGSLLLIDKHAAHERILFEKLRADTEPVMPQLLLTPVLCEPEREEAAVLLENAELLAQYGYEISDYGDGVLAIRQIPTEIAPDDAAQSLTALAAELLTGRHADPTGAARPPAAHHRLQGRHQGRLAHRPKGVGGCGARGADAQ